MINDYSIRLKRGYILEDYKQIYTELLLIGSLRKDEEHPGALGLPSAGKKERG